MAMRSLIKRVTLTSRYALQRRRYSSKTEFPENTTENVHKYFKKAVTNFKSRADLYKIIESRDDEETVRCEIFADDDRNNAIKFADDCRVSSCKFADDDTISAARLVDEDTIGCARFAVEKIAREKNTKMEFVRVLKSSRIPSWDHNYQIILEAVNKDNGEKSLYFAEVESHRWMEEEPLKLATWTSE